MNTPTRSVLAEVEDERTHQDRKWGEQNHPDGTGGAYARSAWLHRKECDEAAAAGDVTWRHILLEEVAEALACTATKGLREELVQVAAVAVSWVEAIDRRAAAVDES